jgi:hypothetical protein
MPRRPEGPVQFPLVASEADRPFFDALVEQLTQMRVIWPSDALALGMLAARMRQYVELKNELDKEPVTRRYKAHVSPKPSEGGTNQLVNNWRRYRQTDLLALHKLIMVELDRLGLTPTARSKVRILPLVGGGVPVPVPRGSVKKRAATPATFVDFVHEAHEARESDGGCEFVDPASMYDWPQHAAAEAAERSSPASPASPPPPPPALG